MRIMYTRAKRELRPFSFSISALFNSSTLQTVEIYKLLRNGEEGSLVKTLYNKGLFKLHIVIFELISLNSMSACQRKQNIQLILQREAANGPMRSLDISRLNAHCCDGRNTVSRIISLRPFFVYVLSVLALLLFWQDVSAQRTEESSRARRQAEATPAPQVESTPSPQVEATPVSQVKATPAPASAHIPTSMAALNGLSLSAGKYAGWVAACDDPATIEQDFMAAAESLDSNGKAHVINSFNNWYTSVHSRTNKALEMRKNPNPRSSGASDPCTQEVGNEYRKQYETDLLSVQKLAASESPAVAPTSPAPTAASSQEPSVAEWSLPPLPASHAGSKAKYERTYQMCLTREKDERICQCRMEATVNYLKENPTHGYSATAKYTFAPCEG